MPDLLGKNLPPIQEKLISSLMAIAVKDNGQLMDFIRELQKTKISRETEIFLVISLCIYNYPELINHPRRGNLEELYDSCFKNPQEMLDILENSMNSKAKEILYAYIKKLAAKYKATLKKKDPPPVKHLLDDFVQHVVSNYDPRHHKIPPKIISYLLEDYARFAAQLEKNQPTPPRKALKRG